MTTLYLVAHKVRGEPAFDIAEQMRCSICQGVGGHNVADFETGIVTDYEGSDCRECEGLGYIWIIPTSGHRAYPYWEIHFDELAKGFIWEDVGDPPSTLPDHYSTRTAPRQTLSDLLGYTKPKPAPLPPIKRRL